MAHVGCILLFYICKYRKKYVKNVVKKPVRSMQKAHKQVENVPRMEYNFKCMFLCKMEGAIWNI